MDIIDKHILQDLYGDEKTALEIINMFIDQAPEFIQSLEEASSNQSLLDKICHKGIGQSRYIGSCLLEEILIELRSAPIKDRPELINKIKTLINNITHAYA